MTPQDIRQALWDRGVKLETLATEVKGRRGKPVSGRYVGLAIDDPSPKRGRHVKRVVARKLGTTIDALWPAGGGV